MAPGQVASHTSNHDGVTGPVGPVLTGPLIIGGWSFPLSYDMWYYLPFTGNKALQALLPNRCCSVSVLKGDGNVAKGHGLG